MNKADALTASREDYLEAIFHIISEKQVARPKDIAERIKVSSASITGALKALAEKGLINYAPYNYITLTPAGITAARDVIRRHEVLRDFFVKVLAVERKDADEAACQMEHSITGALLEKFIQYAQFLEICPRAGEKWISDFAQNCNYGKSRRECENCVSSCLVQVKKQ